MSGSSVEISHGHHQHVPIGRDVSGSSMQSGLMAGKRSLDGNNAAFDMKSLGKHIEAVSIGKSFLLLSLSDYANRYHRMVVPPLRCEKKWKLP